MARQGLIALLLGAALVCAQRASAQDIEAGDRVYAVQNADLKVEADVVATARKNDVLSVREISGKWLWVETTGGERGWIDQQYVTLTAPPPTITLTPSPATTPAPTPQPATTPTPRPQPGSTITRPPRRTDNPATAGATQPDAEATDLEENLLLAVGALSGQNVYVTYAYIGTVADGYANDVYSAEQVQELMKEIVGLCSTAGGYVRTLASANISEEDRASVQQMVGILDLLRQEAEALSAFVVSKKQADLTAYETARAEAWPRIQSALGIQ
jgi:hypothetical protein